jgi:hypothetical protein
MAKTARIAERKRRSLNKRMRVLNKKSKVARRNGSRKRIKMIRGGASWITGENRSKLTLVWNSLFYERAKNVLSDRIKLDAPVEGKKKSIIRY